MTDLTDRLNLSSLGIWVVSADVEPVGSPGTLPDPPVHGGVPGLGDHHSLVGADLLGALHGDAADGPLVQEGVALDLNLGLVPEKICYFSVLHLTWH